VVNVGIVPGSVDWRRVPGESSPVAVVSSSMRLEASKQISHPVYLVELKLKENTGRVLTIRLSSAGHKSVIGSQLFSEPAVDFGVSDYQSVGVSNLTPESVTISLDNSTSRYAFFALSDVIPLKEQRIKVWSAYSSTAVIPNDNIVLSFDGYINDVPVVSEKEVKFTALSASAGSGWTPRVHMAPPLCNHLPKAGTKIGSLVLEPGN